MSWSVVGLRPLHAGGYGDLYIGQRTDTYEYVVVKFLRESHLESARRYFAREIRILKRGLKGLVPLLRADANGSRPYYVMPYLPGGSLRQWAGKLNEGQLRGVALTVATALAELHGVGIAHGDVKPDNVLVSEDGQMRLADPLGNGWGCTVIFAENHGGTPGYWAPEVARGGSISKAGDVYSFGATLYHLVTGSVPVDGQPIEGCLEHYSVPREIREAISACCQADPYARPAMHHVVRILHGERWADIQARRAVAGVAGLVAVCVLAAAICE